MPGLRAIGPRRLVAAFALLATVVAGCWAVAVARQAVLVAPAATPILYDRHGTFLAQLGRVAEGRTEYGFWPLAAPPERLVQATLALEDRRFWRHPGVDPMAVLRAVWQHATGRGRSGASTIAMQVARLQNPRPRTLWAKSVEAGTAVALTLRFGRAAVLAQYLRLAPYGNGSHGAGHAARLYFDKPVADLSWPEAALLASVPRAPGRLNPWRAQGLSGATHRGGRALAALADAGVLDPAGAGVLRGQLAGLELAVRPRRPDALHAIQTLSAQWRAAPPPHDPANPRLRTTLDLGVQTMVAGVARERLVQWRSAGAQQAAVMVLRRDGQAVLASVGAAGAGAPGAGIDFTRALRSPGSTLKPFLYAIALDRGVLAADEVMLDGADGAAGIGNADGAFLGAMLPRQALANSRNVPAATVLRRIGLETGFEALRALGLHDAEGPAHRYGLSMAIGALPTRLTDLMAGYAMLADGGRAAALSWWAGLPPAAPERLLREDTARLVTLFLADPMARLPSFPRYGDGEFPFAVALKTGTSQGYRDAWTLAWSHDYLVGVWVGRADAGPMRGLSGARAAGGIANAVLLRLHGLGRSDLVAGEFRPPAGRVARELCTRTGAQDPGCAGQLIEYLPAQPVAAPAHPAVQLQITAPEANARIWRNPEAPPAANRLALRASVSAGVGQVVWLLDGAPIGTTDPARPFYWPMTRGVHRFQVRLPFGGAVSAPVRVVIE